MMWFIIYLVMIPIVWGFLTESIDSGQLDDDSFFMALLWPIVVLMALAAGIFYLPFKLGGIIGKTYK